MHRTLFTTPIVNTLLRGFSVGFLKLAGWKIEGSLPPGATKSVLIAAPHTSNWDLPYTLTVAFALKLNVYWMGNFQAAASWPDDVAGGASPLRGRSPTTWWRHPYSPSSGPMGRCN